MANDILPRGLQDLPFLIARAPPPPTKPSLTSGSSPPTGTPGVGTNYLYREPTKQELDEEAAMSRAWAIDGIRVEITFLTICTMATLVGTIFVLARCYTRLRILKRWFIEDWYILIAMLLGVGSFIAACFASISILSTHKRALINPFEAPGGSGTKASRDSFIHENAINANVACTVLQSTFGRVSVLATFSRLCIPRNKKTRNLRRTMIFLAVFMVLLAIPVVWISVDPCWPPGPYLRRPYWTHKCVDVDVLDIPVEFITFLTLASFNAIWDIFIFALPFVVFRWAVLSPAHRRELYFLFGFGFLVFLISLFRAIEAARELSAYKITRDYSSFNANTPYLFGVGEANGVMIGASLPVLKPLWRQIRGSVRRNFRKDKVEEEEDDELGF